MRVLTIAVLIGLFSACASVEASRPGVDVEMHNVRLHLAEGITLEVRHLRGRFLGTSRGDIPYLDDPRSYAVLVDTGEIAIGIASLNTLISRALGDGASNLKRVRIAIGEDRTLKQRGVIDKAIDIPFSVTSTVEPTPDGRIRIVSKSVKGFGIPFKPLMKLFKIEMDDMVKVERARGIDVVDNDLIVDPGALLPAPAMRGRVSAVRIDGQSLVQTFGNGGRQHLSPPPTSANYIYWRHGQLSFGKLTMKETDLELVDQDPADPFDFSVEHWNDQLVAGYSKTMTDRGLQAHMPDYEDLRQPRRASRVRR